MSNWRLILGTVHHRNLEFITLHNIAECEVSIQLCPTRAKFGRTVLWQFNPSEEVETHLQTTEILLFDQINGLVDCFLCKLAFYVSENVQFSTKK